MGEGVCGPAPAEEGTCERVADCESIVGGTAWASSGLPQEGQNAAASRIS